jgi:ArsR family transcriptional regulator
MPQSTVSRHLKLLTEGGWLHNRRQGTSRLYQVMLDNLAPAARRLWTLSRDQVTDAPAFKQDQLRFVQRMRERHRSSAAFFAGAAGQWDKLRCELYGTVFSRDAMLALLPSNWTVADLGCGTGQVTVALAEHVAKVIGIDQSEAMLRAARKRTTGQKNVALRRGDLENIPITDGCCDAALLVLVLTYVTDMPVVLGEVRRVLRRGGRLVMVDLLRHDQEDFRCRMDQQCLGFDPDQLKAAFTAAGFIQATGKPLGSEPGAKGPDLLLASAVRPDDTSRRK